MPKLGFADTSNIVATWVTIVSIVAGGGVWLNTYVHDIASRLTDQQKESVKYFDKYSQSEMIESRKIFYNLKVDVHAQVDPKIPRYGSAGGVSEMTASLIQETALHQITTSRLGLDMRRLIEFFDNVQTCVDIDVCDKKVAYSFFHNDAYELSFVMEEYIAQVKLTRPDFGAGLEKISRAGEAKIKVASAAR